LLFPPRRSQEGKSRVVLVPILQFEKLKLVEDAGRCGAMVACATEMLPHYPQRGLPHGPCRATAKNEFLDQRQITDQSFALLREAKRSCFCGGTFRSAAASSAG
jgi:hypothetical protein